MVNATTSRPRRTPRIRFLPVTVLCCPSCSICREVFSNHSVLCRCDVTERSHAFASLIHSYTATNLTISHAQRGQCRRAEQRAAEHMDDAHRQARSSVPSHRQLPHGALLRLRSASTEQASRRI